MTTHIVVVDRMSYRTPLRLCAFPLRITQILIVSRNFSSTQDSYLVSTFILIWRGLALVAYKALLPALFGVTHFDETT